MFRMGCVMWQNFRSSLQALKDCILLYLVAIYSIVFDWINHKSSLQGYGLHGDKVVVITGGCGCIGRHIARIFVDLEATVIIASKDKIEAEDVITSLKISNPLSKASFMELDLAKFQSVIDFTEKFRKQFLACDILINNAGVMITPEESTTDGFDHQFQVNFLSHALLTRLMLPLMTKSTSRILNVSSSAHLMGQLDFEAFRSNNKKRQGVYSPHGRYSASKLAVILHTYSLHRRLQQIDDVQCNVDVCHPGVVYTRLFRHLHPVLSVVYQMVGPYLLMKAEDAAAGVARVAMLPPDVGGGQYWVHGVPVRSSTTSYDTGRQTELWDWTNTVLDSVLHLQCNILSDSSASK